jgi:hypothetical protein
MLRRFFAWLALSLTMAAAMTAMASPARAEWHKAESDRFVIYANGRANEIKEFAEMLERFHVAMELETGRKVAKPSPSNRLTIYMLGTVEKVREVYGNRNSSVGGFYIPRAIGSVAFVPNMRVGDSASVGIGTRNTRPVDPLNQSLRVMLHEYAHHFLIASSRSGMPRWLSEGAAEYFSSARFNDDGSVDIGLPNNSRAYELSQAEPVSVRELLDYNLYLKNRSKGYDAYYGRSWLLYHYLRFNKERTGQLVGYWRAVAGGEDSLAAGERIFGDLDKLEKELREYGQQRKMSGMRFASEDMRIGSVAVGKISKGHAAMMDVITRSKRGVDDELAAEVVVKARAIAAQYPDDPAVLEALAEAEYDAGNDDAAIAAADKAITADANAKNAYVQKGYALFRKAETATDKDAAYTLAMQPFEALNAIETDHTQPLIYFYRSFVERGVAVPDDAKYALEQATILAPFDQALAVEVATMKASDGDPRIARVLLAPVAADPHGTPQSRVARAMMEALANANQGESVDLVAVMKKLEAANDNPGAGAGEAAGEGAGEG